MGVRLVALHKPLHQGAAIRLSLDVTEDLEIDVGKWCRDRA